MRVSSREKKRKETRSTTIDVLFPVGMGPVRSVLSSFLPPGSSNLVLGSWILGLVSRGLDSRLHVVISSLSRSFLLPPRTAFPTALPLLTSSHRTIFPNLTLVLPEPAPKSSELLDSRLRSYLRASRTLTLTTGCSHGTKSRGPNLHPWIATAYPKVPRVCRPRVRLLHLQPPAPCRLFTIYYFRSLPHCGVRRPPPYH
jgi:hypothetical protein